MKEYNDYVSMTRKYLKNYNKLKITIVNLTEELNAQKELLQDESIAISRYGCELGGGSSELNATEAAADRRDKTKRKVVELENNISEIQRIINKLDRALKGLNETDCQLIKGYYIDGYSWNKLGNKNYCTEKWARDKGNKALREVAFMLFGVVAEPQQLKFVFAG